MLQPGRQYSATSSYRYGFNGKENDNEVKGEGNQQDYGMRIYDPRVGRFLSVDPLGFSFPWYSPYHFAGNTPIQAVDLDGGEPKGYHWADPYIASHPGTGVRELTGQYDNQAMMVSIDGSPKQLMYVYHIQDINKRTYRIYETATGVKEQWYIEYDKEGWKGDVNSFNWSKVPNPADLLTWMTVAPLVGLPAIVTGGFLLPSAAGSGPVLTLQYQVYKLFIRYAPTLGAIGRTVAEFLDESGSAGMQNSALRKLAAVATKNSGATKVMLGQYVRGSANSYEKRAGNEFSFFELENYDIIKKIVGKDKMWDINRQFIDDAIAAGKKFLFSHDPEKAVGSFLQEINYLKDKGYNFIKVNDNTWEAIKQ